MNEVAGIWLNPNVKNNLYIYIYITCADGISWDRCWGYSHGGWNAACPKLKCPPRTPVTLLVCHICGIQSDLQYVLFQISDSFKRSLAIDMN